MGDKYAVRWPKNKASAWSLESVSSLNSSGHHPKEREIKSSRDSADDIEALFVFMHYGDIQVIYYSHNLVFS